ncbi:hypothetical protein ON058_00865 [Demequina sp. B12]|uniref:hypothetical protein n=1 Tax=Demequina sp. B12 TaxID=2992757 RepID=UPI00237A448D|nr:hypothetical protein [Demequina sp. B12]MDE0571964.1 hypothetical protein [Demequina sp. B12]
MPLGTTAKKTVTTAALVGALIVAAASPASAATTSWMSGENFVTVDGCKLATGHRYYVAFADEYPSSCTGSVGVQAKIATNNGVSPSSWVWHAYSAVITPGPAAGITSHRAQH